MTFALERRRLLNRFSPLDRGFRTVAWLCLFSLGACGAYFQDRWADLKEIADLTVTVGGGVNLGARVTEGLQVGAGSFEGDAYGWLEGRAVAVLEERSEFGLSILHVYEYRRLGNGLVLDVRHPRFADSGYEEYPLSFRQVSDRGPFDLGLSFHLVLLGANAAVHPDEILDFLLGWFGIDPRKDDAFLPDVEVIRQRARSLDARARANAFDALLRRGEDIHGYAIYTEPDVRTENQRAAIEALSRPREQPVEDTPEQPTVEPAETPEQTTLPLEGSTPPQESTLDPDASPPTPEGEAPSNPPEDDNADGGAR